MEVHRSRASGERERGIVGIEHVATASAAAPGGPTQEHPRQQAVQQCKHATHNSPLRAQHRGVGTRARPASAGAQLLAAGAASFDGSAVAAVASELLRGAIGQLRTRIGALEVRVGRALGAREAAAAALGGAQARRAADRAGRAARLGTVAAEVAALRRQLRGMAGGQDDALVQAYRAENEVALRRVEVGPAGRQGSGWAGSRLSQPCDSGRPQLRAPASRDSRISLSGPRRYPRSWRTNWRLRAGRRRPRPAKRRQWRRSGATRAARRRRRACKRCGHMLRSCCAPDAARWLYLPWQPLRRCLWPRCRSRGGAAQRRRSPRFA
jgi:hypothetical protein